MDGICTACLCSGRKLYNIDESGFFLLYKQILSEIPEYDPSSFCVRVCWECHAMLVRLQQFRQLVKHSYLELLWHLQQNTSKLSIIRPSKLQIQHVSNLSYPETEIKIEYDMEVSMNNEVEFTDDIKYEVIDTETHCEPETFVNNLSLEKPKLKKEVVKKSNKVKKKIKRKVKRKRKSMTPDSVNAGNSDGVSDLETLDYCADKQSDKDKREKVIEDTPAKRKKETVLLKCEQCDEKFRLKGDLKRHMKSQHALMVEDKTDRVVKDTKQKEVLAERPECVECGKVFSSRKTYRYHLNVLHKGQNRYPCPRCGKVYQWKSNLGRHMRTHKARDTGELYCETCDKSFASVATYTQHLRVSRRHVSESEFSFMCNECGKKFVNKTRLRDHIDWEHLKKIKFRCHMCDKAFKCHTSLYVHVHNVHRNKKKDNLCHVCGKSYQNAAKLKYHIIAMHTSETPYQCEQCSAAFGWYSSLYRHVREVHYKMKVQPKKAKKAKKAANEVLPSLLPPPQLPLPPLPRPALAD